MTLSKRLKITLPKFLQFSNIGNGEKIIQFSSYGIFIISFLSIFVCSSLTFLIGINHFIFASIIQNFAKLDFNKYLELKEFAIALGILGLSIYLSDFNSSQSEKKSPR